MKLLYNFKTIKEAEDLDQSLHCLNLISININVLREEFCCTTSRPLLFEACGDFTRWPRIEVEHDNTWDNLGRAYYDSRDYQFTEFHCTLCSVDELKRQVEAWERQYEQSRITNNEPCVIVEKHHSDFMERYFAENHWHEDLLAWIEDFRAKNTFTECVWEADDHSCRPYFDISFYQHQLAKLSLGVSKPQTSVASRPCCRSFLMASCRQLSGDDLLGH